MLWVVLKINMRYIAASIHAEVQLIYYCGLQSVIKFREVISSSKDACFYVIFQFLSTRKRT